LGTFEIEQFIFNLKKDEQLQVGLSEGDATIFEAFDLSRDEIALIQAGDIKGLYRAGVHPLLLAPYARYMRIKPAEYHAELAALDGEQSQQSARRFPPQGV
jgi:hypothetical protein